MPIHGTVSNLIMAFCHSVYHCVIRRDTRDLSHRKDTPCGRARLIMIKEEILSFE